MINKILLTLAVIFGVYLLISFRNRRGAVELQQGKRKNGCNTSKCNRMGWLLAGATLLLVVGFTLYIQLSVPDVVSIQVINSENGHAETYLASPDQVKNRRFKTLDGREVILADTERMEISHIR